MYLIIIRWEHQLDANSWWGVLSEEKKKKKIWEICAEIFSISKYPLDDLKRKKLPHKGLYWW